MADISKITIPSGTYDIKDATARNGIIRYGTCSTAAATAAKVVTLEGSSSFDLETGSVVVIKMTNTNSIANPTLNVNSTGAKSIMRYGTTTASTNANTSWNAGSAVTFVYDGTNWLLADFALRGNDNTVPTAYCSTAAGTAAKAATCTGYVLLTNSYFMLTLTNTNSATSALTLNINGKGAKTIYINGTASSSSNHTLPAGTYLGFYDGSHYHLRTDGKIPSVNSSSIFGGIDGSNLIANGKSATFGTSTSYTAPQDCWMCMYWSTNIGSVKIDGGNIWFSQSQNWGTFWFPMRKGQVVTVGAINQVGANGTNDCVRVYGVK